MVVLRFRDLVWGWSFGKVMCTRVRIKGCWGWFFFSGFVLNLVVRKVVKSDDGERWF